MIKITVRTGGPLQELTAEENSGKSLMTLLQDAGIPVASPCGGNGICGRCMVRVDGQEELSCRYFPQHDITVEVYTRELDVIKGAVDLGQLPVPEGVEIDAGYGLALDIGTTTVAAFLYDLATGKCMGMTGAKNAQGRFGADVISRIRYAENDTKMLQLTALIREQVYDLGCELCEAAGCSMQDIRYISVAGNTVMQSLFGAISPKPIGTAPFKPITLFGEELVAEPVMYFCPCISGYVGGDTTAGILNTGIWQSEQTELLADLGTNCEFALGGKDGFLCASSPAGPAFDRGTGEHGQYGSEFLKVAAELLAEGSMDETGRFYPQTYRRLHPDEELDEKAAAGIQADIRSLQLAKAAVRGAVETILKLRGLKPSQVDRIWLAGGFGAHLDTESAVVLGLFPEEFRGRLVQAGNTSGKGAAMALRQENRRNLTAIAKMCRYEELSGSRLFNDEYINAMSFGDEE